MLVLNCNMGNSLSWGWPAYILFCSYARPILALRKARRGAGVRHRMCLTLELLSMCSGACSLAECSSVAPRVLQCCRYEMFDLRTTRIQTEYFNASTWYDTTHDCLFATGNTVTNCIVLVQQSLFGELCLGSSLVFHFNKVSRCWGPYRLYRYLLQPVNPTRSCRNSKCSNIDFRCQWKLEVLQVAHMSSICQMLSRQWTLWHNARFLRPFRWAHRPLLPWRGSSWLEYSQGPRGTLGKQQAKHRHRRSNRYVAIVPWTSWTTEEIWATWGPLVVCSDPPNPWVKLRLRRTTRYKNILFKNIKVFFNAWRSLECQPGVNCGWLRHPFWTFLNQNWWFFLPSLWCDEAIPEGTRPCLKQAPYAWTLDTVNTGKTAKENERDPSHAVTL